MEKCCSYIIVDAAVVESISYLLPLELHLELKVVAYIYTVIIMMMYSSWFWEKASQRFIILFRIRHSANKWWWCMIIISVIFEGIWLTQLRCSLSCLCSCYFVDIIVLSHPTTLHQAAVEGKTILLACQIPLPCTNHDCIWIVDCKWLPKLNHFSQN